MTIPSFLRVLTVEQLIDDKDNENEKLETQINFNEDRHHHLLSSSSNTNNINSDSCTVPDISSADITPKKEQ